MINSEVHVPLLHTLFKSGKAFTDMCQTRCSSPILNSVPFFLRKGSAFTMDRLKESLQESQPQQQW